MTRFHIMMAVPLLAAFFAPAADARTPILQQCSAPFRVSAIGGTKADIAVAGRASGVNPLEALRARCLLQPPNFITEDRTALSRGIRLARPQSDSIASTTRTHIALQKALTDSIITRYSVNGGTLPLPTGDVTSRDIFLTPEMKALRTRYAAEIRAVLEPEQLVRFERNLTELIAKDTPK